MADLQIWGMKASGLAGKLEPFTCFLSHEGIVPAGCWYVDDSDPFHVHIIQWTKCTAIAV